METAGQPRKLTMKPDVHEGNNDELESFLCEETFAKQERLY